MGPEIFNDFVLFLMAKRVGGLMRCLQSLDKACFEEIGPQLLYNKPIWGTVPVRHVLEVRRNNACLKFRL
jgi:hypothetical protein